MKWRISLISSFLALTSSVSVCPRVLSEALVNPNRILSFQADVRTGSLCLQATGSTSVTAPKIQFLPAYDGSFLLVADFFGLYYPFKAQSVKIAQKDADKSFSARPSLDTINFGQFQLNPAIFRVAIKASTIEPLRQVSFQATPGELEISWLPQSFNNGADSANGKVFSEVMSRSVNQAVKGEASGRLAPKSQVVEVQEQKHLRLIFSTENFGRSVNSIKPNKASHEKADYLLQQVVEVAKMDIPSEMERSGHAFISSANNVDNCVDSRKPDVPKIEILAGVTVSDLDQNNANSRWVPPPDGDSARLSIKTGQKLHICSFRLHRPERYVVDFENLPLLPSSQLPEVPVNGLFRSMRLGSMKAKPNVSRMVLDLRDKNVSVHSELVDAKTHLLLTFNNLPTAKVARQLPVGLHVILDPGHGGADPGARRNGIQEKELTLSIASSLRSMLVKRGINVTLTRKDDTFVSLGERVKLTNELGPNLFLSIHINALDTDRDVSGIETYYQNEISKYPADIIHDSLINSLEVPDRYVRKARFYVINHTSFPAVLAEVGFISCKDERERLISFDYQNRIAKALEQGVILYLEKQSEIAEATRATNSKVLPPSRLQGSFFDYDGKQFAGMAQASDASNEVTE